MLEKIKQLYARLNPYFYLMLSIAYGLLVIFCLVGSLLGKGYFPVVGLVLVCLSWASARILKEASNALQILMHVLKNDDTSKEDNNNN